MAAAFLLYEQFMHFNPDEDSPLYWKRPGLNIPVDFRKAKK